MRAILSVPALPGLVRTDSHILGRSIETAEDGSRARGATAVGIFRSSRSRTSAPAAILTDYGLAIGQLLQMTGQRHMFG